MNRTLTHWPQRLRVAAALAGLGTVALLAGCTTPQNQQAPAAEPAAVAPAAPAPVVAAPAATAPAPAVPAANMPRHRGAPEDRMALRHDRQMVELKAALVITPAQEGAWTRFEAAMQPPALPQRTEPGQWAKLTTPERIDRMDQMMADHQQHFRQMGEATKAFYAQLTPAQQKTFDERAIRAWAAHGEQGRPGMRGKPGMMRHHPLNKPAGRPAAPASQAN